MNTFNNNSGYIGASMSVRAAEAYEADEKPRSAWTKSEIIEAIQETYDQKDVHFSLEKIEKVSKDVLFSLFLENSSWHHTGSYYSRTDFYSLKPSEEIETITDAEIQEAEKEYKEQKKAEKERKEKEKAGERWRCQYLVWSGSRSHPKATKCESDGIIRGDWFYLPDGSKKSTFARGFMKLERVDDESK